MGHRNKNHHIRFQENDLISENQNNVINKEHPGQHRSINYQYNNNNNYNLLHSAEVDLISPFRKKHKKHKNKQMDKDKEDKQLRRETTERNSDIGNLFVAESFLESGHNINSEYTNTEFVASKKKHRKKHKRSKKSKPAEISQKSTQSAFFTDNLRTVSINDTCEQNLSQCNKQTARHEDINVMEGKCEFNEELPWKKHKRKHLSDGYEIPKEARSPNSTTDNARIVSKKLVTIDCEHNLPVYNELESFLPSTNNYEDYLDLGCDSIGHNSSGLKFIEKPGKQSLGGKQNINSLSAKEKKSLAFDEESQNNRKPSVKGAITRATFSSDSNVLEVSNEIEIHSINDQNGKKKFSEDKDYQNCKVNGNKHFTLDQSDDDDDQEFSEEELNLDTTEDPLDFIPPALHKAGTVCNLTSSGKEQLIFEGVKIRTGKWTKREDNIMKQNWQDLCKRYQLDHPTILLGIAQKRSKYMNFLRAKHFYVRLAKGLNDRPLHSVYLRARKLFSSGFRQGRMKSNEFSRALQLYQIHGRKWSKIGKTLNRRPDTVKDILRYRTTKEVIGVWSPEEDESLIKAVQEFIGCTDTEGICHGLKWVEIAKLVPTRNESQCRQHWLTKLCWAKSNKDSDKVNWKPEDTRTLIKHLYDISAESEGDVDWDALAEKFEMTMSYYSLQFKWWSLKYTVPDWETKDFEEIVAYLYHHHISLSKGK
ncbi:transcription termination factor 1-like [Limulus polyphemus]|uniref:Transcription termination factor 1-like n=1 Tax=Limulus polyphemus TaxID=6850 RepID=A0ABM1TF49_LIMPO|nr:transcription termination factor 1-like [Limulus polyphemus]XP_022254501.1 transcription termination factor 1-like [Limulus polyphemus]XP_022254502.1 transcription termination factor 1-like [Limulus polyphemus]XP_022254503.1 transcription termination factor 1-like [Limulus polyphemus]XP_022254504.1 transcription termination factor 1-like [Limulus polyphemus]XP_022254505.1 transcription termination factor 1-like [Limulus polyphemus]